MSNIIDALNAYCDEGCKIRNVEVTPGKHIRLFIDCEDGRLPTLSVPESELDEIQNWLKEKFPDVEIKET